MSKFDLDRFRSAHRNDYLTALAESKNGRKLSHWMWYIFPQLKGLGRSAISEFYGVQGLEEAKAFLEDEYLGVHLLEISNALLQIKGDNARLIMGSPDDMKLKSAMTLFHLADTEKTVFKQVLEKYFNGELDKHTVKMLGK